MTDEEFYTSWLEPDRSLLRLRGKAKYEAETAEIERLKALDTTTMSPRLKLWYDTALSDCYWRRRMFSEQ